MKLTSKLKNQLLRDASAMARHAGEILKTGFSKSKQVKYKGRIDPVTEYDLKSEKLITSRISKLYPDHEILAEEGTDSVSGSPFRWVIDPLDGTVNYAHGFPIYCVSIAVQFEGQPLVGVVYDPERDELFAASQGGGAKLNGRIINVSSERKLDRSMLATGFSYTVATDRKNNLGLFARMVKLAQAVRRPGSAALDLCWLAVGRIDGFWELKLHPWDTAAAMLLVTEAGGKVTRMDGRSYNIFSKDILASNGFVHQPMQKALKR